MESDSQLYLNDFINQKTIMANYPWVLSTITVLWEFCDSGELCSRRYNRSSSPPANIQVLWEFCDSGELCSRRYNRSSSPPANIQVLWEFCDSGELCSRRYNRSSSPPANIQDISTNQELFEKMEMKLNSQDVKAINCSICLSPPTNLVMSSCTHFFSVKDVF
eukprot:TRINITY_DN4086_c1_g1_i5.p1 TRINITY_DN4086_c1_g1~~TRINITY_DN4086_c1_g1_i5.p1  ORF type:complete len:163 (-),score=25.52 TRINITY_DN4086_c1_g1_i5:896-1384(-)